MPPEVTQEDHWFLIRGLTRSKGHWGAFPNRLAASFPHATAHCLDLPGNGQYHNVSTPLTVPEITEFVKREFERILEKMPAGKPRPRCYLLSLSLGSMVAIDWISRYAADFSGCVLMNTSLSGLNPFYKRLRLNNLPVLLRILAERRPEKKERLILKLTSRFPEKNENVIPDWVETSRLSPITRMNSLRQLIAAVRYKVPQRPPAIPVLILSGKGDDLVHPACSEALRNRWLCHFHQHPQAGHDLPLDEPQWVIDQLHRWQFTLE